MVPLPWDEGDSTDALRPTGDLITEGPGTPAAVFDDWLEISNRVVRRLRRLGVDRMTAEDLASDAIAKALTKQVSFASAEHVFNWTMLVAKNLWIDQQRAAARAPEFYAIEDVDVPTHDTAHVAEARMQLRRVLDVLAGMSADDRMAVMSDATPAARKDAVRLNVRRHRARARLRAALAGVAALLGLRRLPRTVAVSTTPVAVAAALLAVLLPYSPSRVPGAAGGVPAPAERTVTDLHDRMAARVAPAAPAERIVARPVTTAAARPAPAKPRPPARKRVARAEAGGGTVYVDTYTTPNDGKQPILCVDNNRLGELCVDPL